MYVYGFSTTLRTVSGTTTSTSFRPPGGRFTRGGGRVVDDATAHRLLDAAADGRRRDYIFFSFDPHQADGGFAGTGTWRRPATSPLAALSTTLPSSTGARPWLRPDRRRRQGRGCVGWPRRLDPEVLEGPYFVTLTSAHGGSRTRPSTLVRHGLGAIDIEVDVAPGPAFRLRSCDKCSRSSVRTRSARVQLQLPVPTRTGGPRVAPRTPQGGLRRVGDG